MLSDTSSFLALCCSLLQCVVAVCCCSVLQFVTVRCSVLLRCVAVRYSALLIRGWTDGEWRKHVQGILLQCVVAVYCRVLWQCVVAVCCSVLKCVAHLKVEECRLAQARF